MRALREGGHACIYECFAFVLSVRFETDSLRDPYCQGQVFPGSAKLNLSTPNICPGQPAGVGDGSSSAGCWCSCSS